MAVIVDEYVPEDGGAPIGRTSRLIVQRLRRDWTRRGTQVLTARGISATNAGPAASRYVTDLFEMVDPQRYSEAAWLQRAEEWFQANLPTLSRYAHAHIAQVAPPAMPPVTTLPEPDEPQPVPPAADVPVPVVDATGERFAESVAAQFGVPVVAVYAGGAVAAYFAYRALTRSR